MIEWIHILALLAAGLVLGLFYFAGLWWTLRRALTSKHPVTWLLASLLVRSTVLLAAFCLISRSAWQYLLVCLLGFIVVRIIVVRLAHPKSEANHAS